MPPPPPSLSSCALSPTPPSSPSLARTESYWRYLSVFFAWTFAVFYRLVEHKRARSPSPSPSLLLQSSARAPSCSGLLPQHASTTLVSLPDAILSHIAQFLTARDIARLSATCKTLYQRCGRFPLSAALLPPSRVSFVSKEALRRTLAQWQRLPLVVRVDAPWLMACLREESESVEYHRQRREMAMRTSDNRSSSTAPLFVSSPVASFSPRIAPKVIGVLQDADESEGEEEQQQQHQLEKTKQLKEMGGDASLVRTTVSTVSLSAPAPCALSRSLSSPALHASAAVGRAMNTGGNTQAIEGAGRRPTALSSPVSLCADPSPPGPASPLVLAGPRNLPGDASTTMTGVWRSPRGTMTPYGLHFGPTRFTPTPGGPWLRSITPLLRELQRVEIEDVPQLYDLIPLAGVRQVLLRRCANVTDDLSPLARARLVDIEACGRAPLDASGLADVQEVRLRGVGLRHAAALETVLRLELANVTLHMDQGEADGQGQRQGERAAHGDNDGGWQEQAVWLAEAANDLAAQDGPGNDAARRCATSILAALLRQPMRGGAASGLTSGVATPSSRCGSGLSLRYHPDGTASRYAHAPPELSGLRAVRSLSRSLRGPIKLIDGVAEVDVLASLPRAVALTAARDALAAMPSMVPGRPGSRGGLASGRASPLFAARLVPPPTPPSTPVHHLSPGSSPPGATSTSTAANRRWALPSSLELANVSSASADGLAPASRVVLRHWPRLRDVSALANVSRLVLFECHGLLDLEPLLQVEDIVLRCCSCISALPVLQRGLARRAELDECAGSALQDLAPLAGAAHVVLSRMPQLRDASALQHCQSVDVIACPQLQGAHLLPIGRRA